MLQAYSGLNHPSFWIHDSTVSSFQVCRRVYCRQTFMQVASDSHFSSHVVMLHMFIMVTFCCSSCCCCCSGCCCCSSSSSSSPCSCFCCWPVFFSPGTSATQQNRAAKPRTQQTGHTGQDPWDDDFEDETAQSQPQHTAPTAPLTVPVGQSVAGMCFSVFNGVIFSNGRKKVMEDETQVSFMGIVKTKSRRTVLCSSFAFRLLLGKGRGCGDAAMWLEHLRH